MACDRIIYNIVLDFLILAVVGLALLMVLLFAEPFERGYFEDDESIRLPFKEQSISEGLLAGICFAIMIVTVISTEAIRHKRNTGVGEKFFSGKLVPGWAWESYRCIGIFTFGAGCQQFTITAGKYVLGRLRPHFIDVCRPIANHSSTLNQLGYIMDYTCTGTDLDLIKSARLSFPSGHSSFAMYAAIFFIFYVQTKTKWRGSKLLRHGVQFAALMGAWYVGLSRVVEHKHHWSDVAGGFFIGAAIAAATFIYVYKPKKYGLPPSWRDAAPQQNALPRPVLAL